MAYVTRLASPLYNAAQTLHRIFNTPRTVCAPVICVGNITAGGSGKTPAAIALMTLIKAQNIAKNPFFLTRGYGGTLSAPTLVDHDIHKYETCGDEALLLARHAPTVVARNRHAGAQFAVQNGADLIIMDDGLQNYQLKKDYSLMVINGAMGVGNGHILPAGPLRESLDSGIKKVAGIIFIGKDIHGVKNKIAPQTPFYNTQISALPDTNNALNAGTTVFAFAGLGYPEKFFTHLKHSRVLNIYQSTAFPDHHPYSIEDLIPIINQAQEKNIPVVTTDKDYLRVPKSVKSSIIPLGIALEFDDKNAIIDALKSVKTKVKK